jgi:hypothetical protein
MTERRHSRRRWVARFADQGANGVAVTKAGVGTAVPDYGGFAFHLPKCGEVERLRPLIVETMDAEAIPARAAEVAAEIAATPVLDLTMLGIT